MLFHRDGSVSTTSGWNYHNRRANAVDETRSISLTAPSGRTDILQAIQATSERHAQNSILEELVLSERDWHALFRALIEAESAYQPKARSPKGAYGLGQLMPETARQLGVDLSDIAQNLDGSARYLLAQLSAFRDIDLALAAYNAGPHRVRDYGGIPPFQETRTYIARVHSIRSRLSGTPTQQTIALSTRGSERPAVVLDLKSVVSATAVQTNHRHSPSTEAQSTEQGRAQNR